MAQEYLPPSGEHADSRYSHGRGKQGPPTPIPPHAQDGSFQPQWGGQMVPSQAFFPQQMAFPQGMQMVPQPLLPMPSYPAHEAMMSQGPPPGMGMESKPPPGIVMDLPPPPKDQPLLKKDQAAAAKGRATVKLFELSKDGKLVPSEKREVSLPGPPTESSAQPRAEPSTRPSAQPPSLSQAQPPSQPQAQPPSKAPPTRRMFTMEDLKQREQEKKDEAHQNKTLLDYSHQANEIASTLNPMERQEKVYHTDFLDQIHELVTTWAEQPAVRRGSLSESARKSAQLPERSSLGGAKQKTPGRQVLEFSREGMRSPPGEKPAVKRSQSAWVPKRDCKEDTELGIERAVKGIRRLLNKVTPTTYDELSEEFCQKRVYEGGEDLLRAVVDLIFEKAVEEEKYCALYAQLCRKQSDSEKNEVQGSDRFRTAITAQCQRTFEHGLDKDPDPEEEDAEAEKARRKRKLLGTIELIAQLYMKSIVTCGVVASCVAEVTLLYEKEKEESYVEYAVKLLETVGKKFHADTGIGKTSGQSQTPKETWDKVYDYFVKAKKSMSPRVRFLVMNLEDLARSNWDDEKRKAKGPRTMQQLEAEEREEERKRAQQREAFNQKQRNVRGLTHTQSSVYATRSGYPHVQRPDHRQPTHIMRQAPGFPPSRAPSVTGSYTTGPSRKPSPAASVVSADSKSRRERERKTSKAAQASQTAGGGSAAPKASLSQVRRSETMGHADRFGPKRSSVFGTTPPDKLDEIRNKPWKRGGDAPKKDEGGEAPKKDEGGEAPKKDEGGRGALADT